MNFLYLIFIWICHHAIVLTQFPFIFHRDLKWHSYLTKKLVQGHSYPQASTEVWPIQIGPKWGIKICVDFTWGWWPWPLTKELWFQVSAHPLHADILGEVWDKGRRDKIHVQSKQGLQKVVLWIDKKMDRCKLSTLGDLQSKAQINLY